MRSINNITETIEAVEFMTDEGFRKVLFIAYYFPPMGLSGVQRTVKFAKFLPKYGWRPTVLTIEPSGYYAFDETLLREVEDAGVRIVRTRSYDVNRLFKRRGIVKMPSEGVRKVLQFFGDLFLIPDTKIGWKSTALRAAMQLFNRERFDLIFATAPPQTDFLVGTSLKKRTGIPLVVDYRDAWLDYPFKYFPTPMHRLFHKHLEKKVLRAADGVIVTHRRVKESILRRHRFVGYNEVTIISQGFDPDDFPSSASERHARPLRMKIAHAGTFYADRNPSVFLRALARVLQANPKMRGRIEVNFIGNIREEDRQMVKKLDLQSVVNFLGYLPHKECVKALAESEVLWFVIDNDYQTPGKLYEYFGARKPIIASVVDGYTKQLINESRAAISVPLKNVAAHEAALLEQFKRFEQKKLQHVSEIFASKFNRLTLTSELAKQFESLMDYDRAGFTKLKRQTA
jgi:glycosyltransferase involved in cell wall biosynthesis